MPQRPAHAAARAGNPGKVQKGAGEKQRLTRRRIGEREVKECAADKYQSRGVAEFEGVVWQQAAPSFQWRNCMIFEKLYSLVIRMT